MTVGEMRRAMLEKIVPESVVPQNIVDFLIDENAELPEPDAFTFLNRLRSLGIGSADFLYLLEGCGAPKEAVDKIKANPAMNLQGLILTLESSGMTARDYTRILYTARQIWERTLTLRLETSERISEGEYPDENADDSAYAEYEEPSFESVMDVTLTDIGISGFSEAAASEGDPAVTAAKAETAGAASEPVENAANSDENPAPYQDATEELMSVDFDSYDFDKTATMNLDATMDLSKAAPKEQAPEIRVTPDPAEESASAAPAAKEPFEVHIASYDEPFNDSYYEPVEESNIPADEEPESRIDVQTSEDHVQSSADHEQRGGSDEIVAASPEDFHAKSHEKFEVKIDYGDEEPAPVEEQPAPQQYNGQTTMIVPIDQKLVRENISKLSEGSEQEEGDGFGETAEIPKTAKQSSKKKRVLDDNDTGYDDEDYERRRKQKRGSGSKNRIHKGVIIGAAVGAVVLIAANIALSIFLSGKKEKPIVYAADADAVFTDIYYSYVVDKIAGGDTVLEYKTDYNKVFGNLLICGNGLGAFTSGESVYSVSESKITAAAYQDGEFRTLGQFAPADGTRFVAAFEADNSLIAVYNGVECGYLKLQGEQTLYTVRQSGTLTDFKFENGEIKLGSVYTPKFYETFKAENTDVYLPKVGNIDTGLKAIEPQDVILSNTKGYSYAMSAAYSVTDGAVKSAKAAMGNPIFASADGCFVMNGSETTKRDGVVEYGLLISAFDKKPDPEIEGEVLSKRCGKIGCAAVFAGGSAVYEDGKIIIRDRELGGCSKLGNLAKTPTELKFSGNVLIASDKDGIFLTVDCSDISNITEDKILRLTQASGGCGDNAAITLEQRADGVKLTRYILENGAAKEITSFTRELSADQAKTLVCGTANAMITRPELCGAAYSYFDGVSVISEYVTLSDASEAATLFDDRTGFEYAFAMNGKIYAVCSKGAVDVTQKPENPDEGEGGNG